LNAAGALAEADAADAWDDADAWGCVDAWGGVEVWGTGDPGAGVAVSPAPGCAAA
jgi:hypothetical protein